MPKNGTISAIMKRYSCRAFTDQVPSEDDLRVIGEAALASPSGMNRQLWRVVVVTDQALIGDLEEEGMKNLGALPDKSHFTRIMERGGKLFYNAPAMIVVPITKADHAGAELMDCGIVAENIAIAAAAVGVNSLICGLAAFAFAGGRREEFSGRLGFPEGYEIGIAVLLGYEEKPGTPHELDYGKLSFVK